MYYMTLNRFYLLILYRSPIVKWTDVPVKNIHARKIPTLHFKSNYFHFKHDHSHTLRPEMSQFILCMRSVKGEVCNFILQTAMKVTVTWRSKQGT